MKSRRAYQIASLSLLVIQLFLATLSSQPTDAHPSNLPGMKASSDNQSEAEFRYTKLTSPGSVLNVTLVERVSGGKERRGAHYNIGFWPYTIPYVIHPTFSQDCPPDWTEYHDLCFREFHNEATRAHAEEACRDFGVSATLFQIKSQQDQLFVSQYKQEDPDQHANRYHVSSWVSGERASVTDSWKLTDTGRVMKYFNWTSGAAPTSAGRQCILFNGETDIGGTIGGWEAVACDSSETHGYMCQLDKASNEYYVTLLKRVMQHISEHVCVTYQDETANWDKDNPNWFSQNGYSTDAYLLIRAGDGCSAQSGPGNNKGPRNIYPCRGFAIMLHEMLHTVGGMHVQAEPMRDNYMTVNRDNITPNLLGTYDVIKNDVMSEYFDPASTLMYGALTWSRNGLETYFPIREDIFNPDSVASSEEVIFMEVSKIYKCNEMFCNNDQTDCGPGYHTLIKGVCRCICPQELDPTTNCKQQISRASQLVSWPDTPMVVFAGGPNHECPTGFDPEPGWFSFTGIWHALEKPVPVELPKSDKDLFIPLCTKSTPGPAQIDWDSWPIGGTYCFIKPVGVDCGGAFTEFTLEFSSMAPVVYNGSLGDTTVNGTDVTMKVCCRGQDNFAMTIDLPNDKPFRILAKSSCPRVNGMRAYKALVDLYTDTKEAYGADAPNYFIFARELQLFECYYQPPVYGCNRRITLDAQTRSVTLTTPGFGVARQPDRRCLYNFDVPPGSKLRLTFDTYDLDEDDMFLVKRYHKWQNAYRLPVSDGPMQLVSESDYMSLEYWAGWTDVPNMGASFTVDVLLPEEFCYDAARNGADYTGDTSVTETYEPCLPWAETLDCADFDVDPLETLQLLSSGNSCRNPGGELIQPWCFTYKNGTNCQKRYCDVCNWVDPVDTIRSCADLIRLDHNFCTSSIQRFGCFKTCNMALIPHNECPDGWTSFGDRCIQYFHSPKSRQEAESECKTYGPSGTLLQVGSAEEEAEVLDFRHRIGHNQQEAIWISGQLDSTGTDWLYTDTQTAIQYSGWAQAPASSPTSSLCAQLMADTSGGSHATWVSAQCDSPSVTAAFFCQVHKRATCGPPNIPSDGVLVDSPRSFYLEGEKVVVRCSHSSNPEESAILCQKSGWTSLQHACSYQIGCPAEWTVYQDRCFYFSIDSLNRSDAEADCRSRAMGGTLFQVRDLADQQMIRDYRQTMGGKYRDAIWISGQLRSPGGPWTFTDTNINMTYFNWTEHAVTDQMNMDCIRIVAEFYDNGGGWITRGCDGSGNPAHHICQTDGQITGCQDKISNCEDAMTVYPTFCTDTRTRDVASQLCLKSCGKCGGVQTMTVCEGPLSNSFSRTSATASIGPGEVMTFSCAPDLYLMGGDPTRACSSSGKLLGSDLSCQAKPSYYDVNLNSLRDRQAKLAPKLAVLLDHPDYRVPFDGKITMWYYFCHTPGTVHFLVYRHNTGNRYSYVGSNEVSCEAGRVWGQGVPPGEQITVLKDDVVGVYSTDKDTIAANNCNNANEQLLHLPTADTDDPANLPALSQFKTHTCVILSLGFRTEP